MHLQRIGLAVFAACLLASAAESQTAKPSPTPPQPKQAPRFDPDKLPISPQGALRDSRTEEDSLVTLDFPGGTLADYVEALRKAVAPQPYNVFVDEPAGSLVVPAVKLTNASLLNSLSLLARSGLAADGRYLNVAVEKLDPRAVGASPTYLIRANYAPEFAGQRPGSVGPVVLSLNPIIGLPGSDSAKLPKLDAKTVLSAVEAAVAVAEQGKVSAPTLKYHEASGLLFIRGSPAQQKMAEQVIEQLRKDIESARVAAEPQRPGEEKRLIVPAVHHDAILKGLHQRFDGQCCIQFVFEGDTLRITGDKVLLDEAAAIAFTHLLQLQGSPFEEQK